MDGCAADATTVILFFFSDVLKMDGHIDDTRI